MLGDLNDLKGALRSVLEEELGLSDTELAEKWREGELVIRSTRGAPREKVIPLESFFKKIVLVRDRLRVLEQRINSHPTLSSEEKLRLDQYVTKAYGSLTTFNFLFDARDDQFVGERKDEPPLPVAEPRLLRPEVPPTPGGLPS